MQNSKSEYHDREIESTTDVFPGSLRFCEPLSYTSYVHLITLRILLGNSQPQHSVRSLVYATLIHNANSVAE